MALDFGPTNVAPWAAAPAVTPAGGTYYNTAEKRLYLSDGSVWNPDAPMRIFATTAARDTWTTAPNGALAITTDTNTLWQRIAGVWWSPFQRLAYVERTTNAGPTAGTTETVIGTLTTPSITIPTANRIIRVEAFIRGFSGVAAEAVTMRIREGTGITGLEVTGQFYNFAPSGSQVGSTGGGIIARSYAPGAAAKQWSVTIQGSVNAANSCTMLATATQQAYLAVYDVGPG